MSASEKKGLQSLVQSLLSSASGPSQPVGDVGTEAGPIASPAPEDAVSMLSDEHVDSLIDVYFELEDPLARDDVFARLAGTVTAQTTQFFLAMMESDEDEYLRAAAAAELARRNVPAGHDRLLQDLEDVENLFFFDNAVTALAESMGHNFFAQLERLYLDMERTTEQRLVALLAMEDLDAEKTLARLVKVVHEMDADTVAEEELEHIIASFVRNEHAAGADALRLFKERIVESSMEREDIDELTAFLDQGLRLMDPTSE